jgi:hypothetical protein
VTLSKLSYIGTPNSLYKSAESGMDATDTDEQLSPPNISLEEAVQSLIERQRATDTVIKAAEEAVSNAEMRNRTMQLQHEEQLNILLRAIERLSATDQNNTANGPNPTGTREWKPPTWDGKTATFRDYSTRMRSSYKTRAGLNPPLSRDYYWDTIYDSLPHAKRTRMRNFWEKGGDSGVKNPEEFFTALEKTFSDTTEKTKALEALVSLHHDPGQPWHEHQLHFDELLHGSHGDRWPDEVKIGHFRKTFSNPARLNTVAMRDLKDYNGFCEEVSRIMNNYEETSQFQVRHKAWLLKQEVPEHRRYPPATATYNPTRIDPEGDTVMTATRAGFSSGSRSTRNGQRERNTGDSDKSTPRAKWVTKAELNSRKEKGLCFRCGASGHRVEGCPYRPAINPSKTTSVRVNTVTFPPMLEDYEPDSEGSGVEEAGKV